MSQPVQPEQSAGIPASTVTTGSRMQRLFDLRYVIAGLLGIYGVVLVVRGLLDGPAELARAAGVGAPPDVGAGAPPPGRRRRHPRGPR